MTIRTVQLISGFVEVIKYVNKSESIAEVNCPVKVKYHKRPVTMADSLGSCLTVSKFDT